ncbi:MAG: hypothetical protein LBH07_04015 [Treponema sp.]|jgi:hypothetical protein|nr:hypothetical protein [Treponema sp.]
MGLLSKAEGGSLESKLKSNGEHTESISNCGGLLKKIMEKKNPSAPLEKAIKEKISGMIDGFKILQGVIIETPRYSAEEFSKRLTVMVSGFGVVQLLSQSRCVVFFDSTHDKELIGRHLAKTVPGENIFTFKAENYKKAFSLLKPYL